MPSVNEVWCISQRKLPIALAKINITPKMKKEQPELSERLLTYQDKCADVLASVFIDNQTASDIFDFPLQSLRHDFVAPPPFTQGRHGQVRIIGSIAIADLQVLLRDTEDVIPYD